MHSLIESVNRLSFNKPAHITKIKKNESPMLLARSNYHEFDQLSDVKINPNSNRMSYYRRQTGTNNSKWGQMKLMMTQIQFMNKYWNPSKFPNPVLLYVGAAPGSWWPLLAKMYPSFEVHLYDPMPFSKALNEYNNDTTAAAKIHIHNKLFEDEDVKYWKDKHVTMFVSDIRNTSYGQEDIVAGDDIVINDMKLQMDWVVEINPAYSQLKFRLPFKYDKNTMLYSYIQGVPYYQPWVGDTSSETRLVTKSPHNITQYNIRAYEEMCMYHNTVTRNVTSRRFFNPFNNSTSSISDDLGLWNDWDSTATIYTLMEYVKKFSPDSINIQKDVLKLFVEIDDVLGEAAEEKRRLAGNPFHRIRLKTERCR